MILEKGYLQAYDIQAGGTVGKNYCNIYIKYKNINRLQGLEQSKSVHPLESYEVINLKKIPSI